MNIIVEIGSPGVLEIGKKSSCLESVSIIDKKLWSFFCVQQYHYEL